MERKMTIDELLQTPYHIIDILPAQVPANGPGQYFAVERYFLMNARLAAIKQKHVNVVLKLNCYRDIALDDEAAVDPPPERVSEAMKQRYVCIRVDEALLVSQPDSTYLTLYNAGERLLQLIAALAQSEGLFVWQP